MESKKPAFLNNDFFRVIMIVLGSAVSTAVLTFAILAILQIQEGNLSTASNYLLVVFIVLGLSRLVTLFKEKTKVALVRFIVLLVFNVALGVIIYFGKNNPYFYSLCGGLYCLTVVVSRIFIIIQKRTIRNFIFSGIIIVAMTILAIGLFIPVKPEETAFVVLIVCLIVALSAFVEVFSNATSQLKVKTLFKIILKTYALEIILGLLTMMVASSLIFMLYEPSIETFADGMWYAFAIVTTIGFGDFTAVTPIGRVLSVILGIYGLLVVAVITSIIVNFYNETAGKHDVEGFKQVQQEEQMKEEKKKQAKPAIKKKKDQ